MSTRALLRPSPRVLGPLLLLLVAAVGASRPGALPPQAGSRVYRVPVTGPLAAGSALYVPRAIHQAEEAGATAVVLELDVPGGRLDAARQIVDAVRSSRVPVFAYVRGRALSVGALLALSTGGLYMHPGATIGAPASGEAADLSAKAAGQLRAALRNAAAERGLDPALGAAMAPGAAPESAPAGGGAESVPAGGEPLTLDAEQAVSRGVAAGEVAGMDDLLEALGLQRAKVVSVTPSWAERLIRFLTQPIVAPLLLSLGFFGLLLELKMPTFGVIGGLGLLLLAAFFGSRVAVHLAGTTELVLLGVGAGLILAEIFVIPGFGVAGILGFLAVLGSAYLSMVGRFPTSADLVNAGGLLSASLLLLAALAYAVLRHIPYSRSLSGIFLRHSTSREGGYVAAPRRQDLVGAVGVAITDLRPSGTAEVEGERVDVVTEGPWIEAGTRLVVLRAEGYRHVVRQVASEEDRRPDTEEIAH